MIDNVVDYTDNQVGDNSAPGWLVVVQLLGAFRALVDEAHEQLAAAGHPEARPVHGFALQAVGAGATAAEIAARLGVSKQAAAKTIARLEGEGYLTRGADPTDARRKLVVPTALGQEFLAASAASFDDVVRRWRHEVGDDAIDGLVTTLARLGVAGSAKLDLGSWSSSR